MSWQSKVHWASVVIMPYYDISRRLVYSVAEILRVNGFQFQIAAVRHLEF